MSPKQKMTRDEEHAERAGRAGAHVPLVAVHGGERVRSEREHGRVGRDLARMRSDRGPLALHDGGRVDRRGHELCDLGLIADVLLAIAARATGHADELAREGRLRERHLAQLAVAWTLRDTIVLIAITAFEAAYIAEVVRGGFQAVPAGQVEAAQAVGLAPLKTMRLIVLAKPASAIRRSSTARTKAGEASVNARAFRSSRPIPGSSGSARRAAATAAATSRAPDRHG